MSINGDVVNEIVEPQEPLESQRDAESVGQPFEVEPETERSISPIPQVISEKQDAEDTEAAAETEFTEETWRDSVAQLREQLAASQANERNLQGEVEYLVDLIQRVLQNGEQQAERRLCDHLRIPFRNMTSRAEMSSSRGSMSSEQLVHLSVRTMELDEILTQHRIFMENQPIHTLSRPQSGSAAGRAKLQLNRPPSASRMLKTHTVAPSPSENGTARPRSPPNLRLGPIGRAGEDDGVTVGDILNTTPAAQQVIPITTPVYWASPSSHDVASSARDAARDNDRYEYDQVNYRSGLFNTKGLLRNRPKSGKPAQRPPNGRNVMSATEQEPVNDVIVERSSGITSARITIPRSSEPAVNVAANSNAPANNGRYVFSQQRAKSAVGRKQYSVRFNDLSLNLVDQRAGSADPDSARLHQMENDFKHRTMDFLQKRLGLDEHGMI